MPSTTFNATASSGRAISNDPIYANAHNAAVASGIFSNFYVSHYWWTVNYSVGRVFLFFNTASLSGKVIQSASLQFGLVDQYISDIGQMDIHVVEGVQNDPIIDSDFGAHLTKVTSGGSIAYGDIPVDFVIPLNATGKSWINKTGTTKFCLRASGDINDNAPTVQGAEQWVGISSPQLVVTYYAAGFPESETGRVGSLVHRRDVDRGIYNLEITFGGLIATPPSTGRASMAVGAGEQPYDPVPEVVPTCPPGWTLRYNAAGGWYCEPPAITGQPYSKLTNLTPYAQQRAQSLYEQGMIDESGQITEYGRWWISQHPTESPP